MEHSNRISGSDQQMVQCTNLQLYYFRKRCGMLIFHGTGFLCLGLPREKNLKIRGLLHILTSLGLFGTNIEC